MIESCITSAWLTIVISCSCRSCEGGTFSSPSRPQITYFKTTNNSQSVFCRCFTSLYLFKYINAAIDDLIHVKRELLPVTERWKAIGLALGLKNTELKKIERENRDLEDCLTDVLDLWLKENYNTERFGEPSWELLARAVADPAGGKDSALAERIATKYGGWDLY